MTTTERHSLATFKKHSAIFMRNIYFWSILYVMANSMCYSQFLVRFLFGCFLNQQHSICLHVCKTAVCCLSVNVVSGSFMALKKRQKTKNKEETKKKQKKTVEKCREQRRNKQTKHR